jgi:DNA-binding transcriptional regulator YhcF (GntR family)/anti-sigma regulatory factor (Ser/Thr protein kinase)
VQDLLDVSRIEAGHFAIHRERAASTALIDEAISLLRPLAEAKAIRLQSRLSATLPPVLADRQRIVQVFMNLVTNAIRHVPEGGSIALSARSAGQEVRFSVRDSGPGISEAHLPHVFDRFWQAAGPGRDGLGLGLAIARGIVEAHGGRIWAESQEGKGSTFHFTLPVPSGDTAAANGEEAEPDVAIAFLPGAAAVPTATVSGMRQDAPQRQADAAERSSRFLEEVSRLPDIPLDSVDALAAHLRDRIMRALHLGYLRVNDRLPSIRQIANTLGVPYHSAVQAYESLATDGIAEKRERSGIYLAPQTDVGGELQTETARWVAQVLLGAWVHQIRVPRLPDLIRRFTAAVPLRCACMESTEEHRVALAMELSQQFGLQTTPIHVPDRQNSPLTPEHDLWWKLQEMDLLVTTSFHAPRVRRIAEELGKPLIVMTIHPEVVAAVDQRLAEAGELTVVCVDPTFGERVRSGVEAAFRDRIRVVLADDARAVESLDRSQPVLLTRAARQRLPEASFRLIVPVAPSFSVETAWDITTALVRFNMEAARG